MKRIELRKIENQEYVILIIDNSSNKVIKVFGGFFFLDAYEKLFYDVAKIFNSEDWEGDKPEDFEWAGNPKYYGELILTRYQDGITKIKNHELLEEIIQYYGR